MKIFTRTILLMLLALFITCEEPRSPLDIDEPVNIPYAMDSLKLSDDTYYDKVLGALVGSAIGDAMGAPTEMWDRNDIRLKYGYVTGLTRATRVQSAEGSWEHNLEAGATTDDTRWKYLMVKYFGLHRTNASPQHFAKFITDYYQEVASGLADKQILIDPDVLDSKLEKVDWIKEWARVALAYQKDNETFMRAQSRFYGGEMSCAGMLYTPMFGIKAPNPEVAYDQAYKHTLFDHGYAKDISSLVAVLAHMAMRTQSMDSILNAAIFVDPYRYQDSRLVGRISNDIALDSRKKVWLAREIGRTDSILSQDSLGLKIPAGYNGSDLDWVQQEFIYRLLEENQRDIAFHAGEIWEILITGLEYGQGDFNTTLQFIVNYGRDNDTTGAIAGFILGAKVGYSGLPEQLKTKVLAVNKNQLGIDLEALAKELAGRQNPVPTQN